MTIDEAIKRHQELANYIDEVGDGSGFREVANMLEELEDRRNESESLQNTICKLHDIIQRQANELKWYREHDLIDREDVLWVVKYNCDQPKKLMRVIEEMPKAEPTSSKKEQVGDCETCKHYQTMFNEYPCEDCLESDMSKYEPYTSKE